MKDLYSISPHVRFCGISRRSKTLFPYTISSEKFNVFIFVAKGNATHEVNGRKRTLVQGTVEIIPPFFHQVITTYSEDDTEIYYIYFDLNERKIPYEFEEADKSGAGIPPSELYFADKPCYKMLTDEFDEAKKILEELMESYQRKDEFTRLECKSLMLRLLLIFLKAKEIKEKPICSTADRHVAKAMRYIEKNCSFPSLCAKDVAAYIGLTTDYLSGLFEKQMHVSLPKYIRITRIKRAKELFFIGKKCGEVSLKCGFSSVQSFCRTFKAEEGITPGEYIKNM